MAATDPSDDVTALKPTQLNVVITGASSGIGAAPARSLSAEGHRVVPTDVTVRAQVEKLRDQALAALGHIDVWVNNAGHGIGRKVLELRDDELDEMLNINLKAALYGSCSRTMRRRRRSAARSATRSSSGSR